MPDNRPTDPAQRAMLIAARRGMTEAQGRAFADEVHGLMRESLATEEAVESDETLTNLMMEGLFTEANPNLHLDLAFIGVLVREGFIRGTGD